MRGTLRAEVFDARNNEAFVGCARMRGILGICLVLAPLSVALILDNEVSAPVGRLCGYFFAVEEGIYRRCRRVADDEVDSGWMNIQVI